MPAPTRAALMALVSSGLLLGGCSDDEPTETGPPPMGRVTVHLTDAPFPFDMVDSTVVHLDSVSVRVTTDDGVGDGFYTIDRTARSIDLLELRDGVTDSIASALVPAGDVDQIRLYVGTATIYLDDGRNFNLTVPSGSSSGIKVFPEPAIDVPADGVVEFLLDFDVSSSFSAIPNSAQQSSEITEFHFHPVLRVANLPVTGGVQGRVWEDAGVIGDTTDDVPLEDAAVTAYLGGVDAGASATDATGHYTLMGLEPGAYRMVATATGFEPDTVDVNVVAGIDVTADDLVLEPSP